MTDDLFTLARGDAPLLVSIPHLGTWLPDECRAGMTDAALLLQDTDWHLDRLYDFAAGLGATVLGARVSRYVIDLNRPPDGRSLYPGQTTTGLFPQETFLGDAVWSAPPHEDEKNRIIAEIWKPYHDRIRMELDRLVA